MTQFALPDISDPVIDRSTGMIDPQWYRFFELIEKILNVNVNGAAGLAADILALQGQEVHTSALVSNLQAQFEDFGNVTFVGTGGISGSGSINGSLTGSPIELSLTAIANKNFLANFSGGAATPIAVPFATVLGHADFIEAVQDIVGAMTLSGGGITVTYNDGAGTLTLSVP